MTLGYGAAFALMWLAFALYLGLLATAPRLPWRLLAALAVAAAAAFALVPPLLSHDVYSYVDYARLGAVHHLNPYVHPPAAAPGDPAFAHVDWTDATSAYGPLFTLATYPLALLPVNVAVWTLKLASGAAVLALAALVARLAAARGVEPRRAAVFVAFNPLVLVHVVGGPHNDGFALLAATVGAAAVLAARDAGGGAAFVAAAAVKASAVLTAPFALLGARRRGAFLAGAAVALALTALVSLIAFGAHPLSAIGLSGENQSRTSHLSIPVTIARLVHLDGATVRAAALALYAVLLAGLLAWTMRGGDWLRAAAWAALGLLLATSWLLPWYLIWALPFVALARDRSLAALTLALSAYQLAGRMPM